MLDAASSLLAAGSCPHGLSPGNSRLDEYETLVAGADACLKGLGVRHIQLFVLDATCLGCAVLPARLLEESQGYLLCISFR